MKLLRKHKIIAISVLAAAAIIITTVAASGGFDSQVNEDSKTANNVDFGASAVEDGKTYSLPEMLTYAIQDEYLAHAEYERIIDDFGDQRPFINIIKAEEEHISTLEPLFAEYDVTIPENNATDYITVPGSLLEANASGVEAEIKNIAMYEVFLGQDLPDDVRAVFTSLKNASENHLSAFEKGVERLGGSISGNT
ncbi:MAG: DUF2202 domain-containing protein [Oscillospiraceae bacterium]